MPKKKSFQENYSRLEEIVEEIELNTDNLDKTVELYKEGVGVAIKCNEALSKYSTEIYELNEKLDNSFQLDKFE